MEGGATLDQRAPLAYGMQEREGGGPQLIEGERGTPEQERTSFMRGLIHQMGGGALKLKRPPTAIQSRVEGERG